MLIILKFVCVDGFWDEHTRNSWGEEAAVLLNGLVKAFCISFFSSPLKRAELIARH